MTMPIEPKTGFIQTAEQLQVKSFSLREALTIYKERESTLVNGVFRVCPLADQFSLLLTYNVDDNRVVFKVLHGYSFEEITDLSLIPIDAASAYVSARREFETNGNLPLGNEALTTRFLEVMHSKYGEAING